MLKNIGYLNLLEGLSPEDILCPYTKRIHLGRNGAPLSWLPLQKETLNLLEALFFNMTKADAAIEKKHSMFPLKKR